MSTEIRISNLPSMNIGEIVEQLSELFSEAINSNIALSKLPSVMLWGPPGVGKSDAIRQISSEIELNTGKKVNVTDVRLLLFNPIDLRGIPTANEDKTLAVWLRPKIFDMDDSDNVVNILFLDEISAAPQSVQAAAYQITLDRTIGEHKLPDNCIVIAAGNRVTDKSVVTKMPKALANRLMHLEVSSGLESWKRWAVSNGINEKVIGYLTFREDALMNFESTNDKLAFATPRSWEMVSNLLNMSDGDVDSKFMLIAGLIGMESAIAFRTWVQVYSELPDITTIFKTAKGNIPENSDALYALVSSMTAYATKHRNDLKQIGNSIKYACKLPPDYSVVLIRDYMYIEKGYREKLMLIPEMQNWLSLHGSMLNGII